MNKNILYDIEDAEMVEQYTWYVNKSKLSNRDLRYAEYKFSDGSHMSMHRFLMGNPKGKHVDHINGNGLDNRRSNLRIATISQNLANTDKHSHNTSGYKGVYWDKVNKKWKAQITKNNKVRSLGRYVDILEAAKAYDNAAISLHGEFARLNLK